MKVIKKITAIMLSIMMVLGMSSVVSAAETSGTSSTVKGKITINNAVPGQTYTIYKILDLESYDVTDPNNGHYAYKVASGWNGFITGSGEGAAYLKETEGYVNWNGEQTDARKAEFAKKALAYARDNSLANQGSNVCAQEASTVEFDNLALGYYLVDSSVGTLCYLNTTNKEVTIQEKNVAPTVDKKVQEDSKIGTADEYGESNTADIGQKVKFQTTITAQAGAQNYVLHDKMDAGLTFDGSVNVKSNGTAVDPSNYTLNKATDTPSSISDDCTFELVFVQGFCDTLNAGDTITVEYSATLNENAQVGTTGNKNKTWLKYGENKNLETAPSETTTKTYEIPVFKYTEKTTGNKTGLPNAEFTLSKNENGTDPISLVDITGGATDGKYRVAKTGDATTTNKVITLDTGKFTIQGLDADTYYLTETKQPAGYNKLSAPVKITIAEDGKITVGGTTVTRVDVENKSGSLLPSTGGRGTTLFYILGAILVVGSGVVLITKKRMK